MIHVGSPVAHDNHLAAFFFIAFFAVVVTLTNKSYGKEKHARQVE